MKNDFKQGDKVIVNINGSFQKCQISKVLKTMCRVILENGIIAIVHKSSVEVGR